MGRWKRRFHLCRTGWNRWANENGVSTVAGWNRGSGNGVSTVAG